KRSSGIRSASINFCTIASISMPEAIPPTRITISLASLNFLVYQYSHIFSHRRVHIEHFFGRNLPDDLVCQWIYDCDIIFMQVFMKDKFQIRSYRIDKIIQFLYCQFDICSIDLIDFIIQWFVTLPDLFFLSLFLDVSVLVLYG